MSNPKSKPTLNTAQVNVLPSAIEFEMAVLGAILIGSGELKRVVDKLFPEIFYRPAHKHIYVAILDLFSKSKEIDSLTVVEQLRKNGKFEEVGGFPYIAELTGRVASAANLESHTAVIMEKYAKRESINAALSFIESNYDPTTDYETNALQLNRGLLTISQKIEKPNGYNFPILNIQGVAQLEKLANNVEERGAAMPFWRMVDSFPYFAKGGYTLIGADTGVGKSALMQNILMAEGEGLFFGFEMKAHEVWKRALAMKTYINSRKFLAPENLTTMDWLKINDGVTKLDYPHIHIYDDPFLTIENVYAICVKMFRERYYPFIVIDYLQRLFPSNPKFKEIEHCDHVSQWLKNIAIDLNTHVISASQFRDLGGKRPTENDLKGSRNLKMDPDNIILLWRPDTASAPDMQVWEDIKSKAKIPIKTRQDFLPAQRYEYDRIVFTITKGRSIGRGNEFSYFYNGATNLFVDPQDLTTELIDKLSPINTYTPNQFENGDPYEGTETFTPDF